MHYIINEMATEQTKKVFTEQEWNETKNKARREMGYVDIRPYSHNILGLYMADMNDEQMRNFATELELEKLGWGHLDTHGEISETDKQANKIAYALRCKRMELLHDEPSENENEFYSKMMKPNDLLALKEICKLYSIDRVKDLLTEMENDSE